MNLGAPELLIVLVVVLVLFGGRKLPELARSLGQAKRELDSGMKGEKDPVKDTEADGSPTA
jgi:sec-independent protein translocase protein TatA